MGYEYKPIDWTSPTGVETKLYPIGVLAYNLGRSTQTVRKWEVSGVIPATPFKNSRGQRLYSHEMIDEVVKNAFDCHISQGSAMLGKPFANRNYKAFQKLNEKYFGETEEVKVANKGGIKRGEIEESD